MEAGKGLGRCLANRIARTTESDKGAGLAQRAAHYRRRAAATNRWTTKYPMEMGELDKNDEPDTHEMTTAGYSQ